MLPDEDAAREIRDKLSDRKFLVFDEDDDIGKIEGGAEGANDDTIIMVKGFRERGDEEKKDLRDSLEMICRRSDADYKVIVVQESE